MTRVLVPTDFSEPSLAAVRSGIELATAVGGVVVLLHVVEGASVRCYAGGGPPLFLDGIIDLGGEYFRLRFEQKLIRRDFCEEACWKLDALVPTGRQAPVHTVVAVGRAVDEIVRAAKEQHADLILLGAHGPRGWRRVFRRTMADRVRRKALIPVVTLDAHDLCVGRDPGRRSVPDQGVRSDRAASYGAELVGVVKDMEATHRPPRMESTSQPHEDAANGPEPHALPYPASQDERGRRHANTRSQAVSV